MYFSECLVLTVCKQYGTVVDAFIPDRRSKADKRFDFVRFIKIFDVDRLVNNLCTIWVGRFKLHANIARFQRPPLNKNNSQSSHNKGDQSAPKDFYKESGENVNSKSYAHVVNAGPHQFHKKEDSPAIVLDETYANKTDYSLALLGKVKDFTSLTNLNVVLANEEDIDQDSKSDDELSNEGSFDKNRGMRITPNVEGESDLEEVAETNLMKSKLLLRTLTGKNPGRFEAGDIYTSSNQGNFQKVYKGIIVPKRPKASVLSRRILFLIDHESLHISDAKSGGRRLIKGNHVDLLFQVYSFFYADDVDFIVSLERKPKLTLSSVSSDKVDRQQENGYAILQVP
ncbi:nucleotide-binding alpha-beta plait domain-containing protein [Tanacetum coccineum]|uniref:Nucleotide-binding alpha-beta plait domain-containing protein n=1 Tax=Tanacetum coccineum TaxID=301880 RepID=A0ABQ4YXC9_9ASTR